MLSTYIAVFFVGVAVGIIVSVIYVMEFILKER